MKKFISLSLLSLFVCYSIPTLANTNCNKITDNKKRLICYDSLYRDPTVTTILEKNTKQALSNSPELKQNFNIDTMSFKQIFNYADKRDTFKLTPHLPNFILPASYNIKQNKQIWQKIKPDVNIDNVEVKFQISGKMKVVNNFIDKKWDIWLAYTHTSWWQLYNADESAPFRETNYMPEIISTYYPQLSLFNMDFSKFDFSLVHQSNGRSDPLSRSWNRVKANFVFTKDNFSLIINPWYRISEHEDDDDNSTIHQYMGYGDYQVLYKHNRHIYSLLLRNNFRTDDNRGGGKFMWAFPITNTVKGYLEYYNGYGESLIDYDHYTNRLSAGILIYNWF